MFLLLISIEQTREVRQIATETSDTDMDCLLHRFAEIVGYLERQYDDILAEESRIKRNPRFRDNRVHALLYFITPTGHA